ncbi:MAG: hypothetical protein AB8C95_02760 [Phycisphaeraceae bacterium]
MDSHRRLLLGVWVCLVAAALLFLDLLCMLLGDSSFLTYGPLDPFWSELRWYPSLEWNGFLLHRLALIALLLIVAWLFVSVHAHRALRSSIREVIDFSRFLKPSQSRRKIRIGIRVTGLVLVVLALLAICFAVLPVSTILFRLIRGESDQWWGDIDWGYLPWSAAVLYSLIASLLCWLAVGFAKQKRAAAYSAIVLWVGWMTLYCAGVVYGLILMVDPTHNVTTGISAGAAGLVLLIGWACALPLFCFAVWNSIYLWRHRREFQGCR